MENAAESIGLILVIGALITAFNIVLFFKIWVMTNDTRAIRNILQEWLDIEHPLVEDGKSTKETRKQKVL